MLSSGNVSGIVVDSSTTTRAMKRDAAQVARKIAAFVKDSHLDGVDVDYVQVGAPVLLLPPHLVVQVPFPALVQHRGVWYGEHTHLELCRVNRFPHH